MYPIYRWLYRQFAFSRSQSNGFLILLPLSLLFVFSEPMWRLVTSRVPSDHAEESRYLDSLMLVLRRPTAVLELGRFEFDPNHSSAEELQSLGFEPSIARRITAYTGKGGRFRTGEDLLRIYGVDTILVRNLLPWVRIAAQPARNKAPAQRGLRKEVTAQRVGPFDLNLADTIQLKQVRGIGSKLSQRIIRYREALGGFYSQDQLYEVFKLDSSVVDELRKVSFIAGSYTPRKIAINSAERDQLAGHPYLNPREAAAIVAYRFMHGKFVSLEDLGKIGGLDSLRISRVTPYLNVD